MGQKGTNTAPDLFILLQKRTGVGGFLIKGFWILIWKGDGGSNKVKIKNKSFITLTFTRTKPPENKTLSLIVLPRPVKSLDQKK